MTIKHIALLTTTALTPFATHAMEQTRPLSEALTIHKKSINNLCAQSCAMLQDFKVNDKNSAQHLVSIIEQMNCLKDAKITEQEIGFFLFKQHQKQSLSNTIKNTLFYDVDPLCATIFFECLANYNQGLTTSHQVSPNITQIMNHWKNQNLHRVANNCPMFGVTIPESTLTEKRIPTQAAIGVTAFDQLMLHIDKIIHENPKDIKTAAKLVYHNALKSQSAPPLSKDQSNLTETK